MLPEYLKKKYKDIRTDYGELKKEGYEPSVRFKKLAKKYYMSSRTIEDIIYQNGIYSEKPKVSKEFKDQLNLFSPLNEEIEDGKDG